MSATQPLWSLLSVDLGFLSKKEMNILEAELFFNVLYLLKEQQRKEHQSYFRLMNFNKEKENEMLDTNFARSIINDLLKKEDYTLDGIAAYTYTDREIVEKIYQADYINPPINFMRKLVELHRASYRELYLGMVHKIALAMHAIIHAQKAE